MNKFRSKVLQPEDDYHMDLLGKMIVFAYHQEKGLISGLWWVMEQLNFGEAFDDTAIETPTEQLKELDDDPECERRISFLTKFQTAATRMMTGIFSITACSVTMRSSLNLKAQGNPRSSFATTRMLMMRP